MRALRHRDFRLIWLGELVSSMGDWFLVLALPLHIYGLTHSPLVVGLVYAAQNVPAVIVGPLAGVVVDRLDRRHLMMSSDAARVVLLSAMVATTTRDLWALLLAGAIAERMLAQLHDPAAAALIPNLVGVGDDLTSANAAFGVSSAVVRLTAAPLGGLLYAAVGIRVLLAVDAATFAISLMAVAGVAWRQPPISHPDRTRDSEGLWFDLRTGLEHIGSHPILRWLTVTCGAFLFCNGALSGQLVTFTSDRLGTGAAGLGALIAGLGIGYLLGAVTARFVTDASSPTASVTTGLAVVGTGFIVLFTTTHLSIAIAGALIAGAGGSVTLVVAATILQRHTPDSLRGRVASASQAVQQAAQVLGAAAGAVAVSAAGLLPTLVTAGLVVVGIALLARRTEPVPASGV